MNIKAVERAWGIVMTLIAAILLGIVTSTPEFMSSQGVAFMEDHIMDKPIKVQLDNQYTSNEFMEQQLHETQIYRMNQDIYFLDRESKRPSTTQEQRMELETQKSRIEVDKADVQRRFDNRSE
jgi:hypothetical protein